MTMLQSFELDLENVDFGQSALDCLANIIFPRIPKHIDALVNQ